MDGIETPTKAAFVASFGHIFEHSPWVIERAWAHRPFADIEALHRTFMMVVGEASPAEQLALINAHPELGAKIALTEASTIEQTGAGLKNLSPDEYQRFLALNAAYREKFGFPFIICVRRNTKASILAAYHFRLKNDAATEHAQAIGEIGLIARLRLQDLWEEAET